MLNIFNISFCASLQMRFCYKLTTLQLLLWAAHRPWMTSLKAPFASDPDALWAPHYSLGYTSATAMSLLGPILRRCGLIGKTRKWAWWHRSITGTKVGELVDITRRGPPGGRAGSWRWSLGQGRQRGGHTIPVPTSFCLTCATSCPVTGAGHRKGPVGASTLIIASTRDWAVQPWRPRLLRRGRRPSPRGEAVLCSLLPGRLKGKINAEVLKATNPPPVVNTVPPLSFQTTLPTSPANGMCHQHGNHVMCFIVMRKPSVSPESQGNWQRYSLSFHLCVIFNFFL